jgi:hypothetical protein
MLILKESNKAGKDNCWLVHVNLGEVGLAINAPSKEEAIKTANELAHKKVTAGTCSFTIPKIVRINGEPYRAPPIIVRDTSRIS